MSTMRLLPPLVLVVLLHACGTKPHGVQWTKSFAGWGQAYGSCVLQTMDGGYIAVGSTDSPDSATFIAAFLVKLSPSGDTQWTRAIKSDGGIEAFSVAQTSDSGYIVAGRGADADSAFGYLIKTSASGNEAWRSRLYITGAAPLSVTSVVTLGDTSYAAIVQDAGDSAVIFWRIDSGGRFRTSHKYDIGYGLEWTDEDLSMRRTSDGGYIIGTRTLLKVGPQGENPQLKVFGSVVSANSVIQTSDGGYAATGAKPGAGIYLLKTNANRESLWMNAYAQSEFSRGHWIEQTSDSGYIIAGTTRPGNHQGDKVTLIRTSSNGSLQWTDTLFDSYGNCVRQTTDGGFIVCGMRGINCMFVTKLAPDRTR